MLKLFGIGLPKTGNTSLANWLRTYGLLGVQYPTQPQWLNLEDYDFIVDTPCNLYYQILFTLYPDAKFILTIRDNKQWIRSWITHQKRVDQFNLGKWRLRNHDLLRSSYSSLKEHQKEVLRFFQYRDNLFIFDLDNQDIDTLADFCGFDKVQPFPHRNRTKADNAIVNP